MIGKDFVSYEAYLKLHKLQSKDLTTWLRPFGKSNISNNKVAKDDQLSAKSSSFKKFIKFYELYKLKSSIKNVQFLIIFIINVAGVSKLLFKKRFSLRKIMPIIVSSC